VKTLLESGFEVAVLHNRGVGNTPYTSLKFADLSCDEEFVKMLTFVKTKAGDGDLVGIGLSMGGNVMMRLAGQMKDKFPLKAIVSVNNPFDLWLSINLMRGSPYEKHLAQELKKNLILPDFRPEDD
jgi:predicted alpha/beta-fold hydrolase